MRTFLCRRSRDLGLAKHGGTQLSAITFGLSFWRRFWGYTIIECTRFRNYGIHRVPQDRKRLCGCQLAYSVFAPAADTGPGAWSMEPCLSRGFMGRRTCCTSKWTTDRDRMSQNLERRIGRAYKLNETRYLGGRVSN